MQVMSNYFFFFFCNLLNHDFNHNIFFGSICSDYTYGQRVLIWMTFQPAKSKKKLSSCVLESGSQLSEAMPRLFTFRHWNLKPCVPDPLDGVEYFGPISQFFTKQTSHMDTNSRDLSQHLLIQVMHSRSPLINSRVAIIPRGVGSRRACVLDPV